MSDSSSSSVKSSDNKEDLIHDADDRAAFRKEIFIIETEMMMVKKLVDNLKQKGELKVDSNDYDIFVKCVDCFITRCCDLCDRTDVINKREFDDLIALASEVSNLAQSMM